MVWVQEKVVQEKAGGELSDIDRLKQLAAVRGEAKVNIREAKGAHEKAEKAFEDNLRTVYANQWVRITGFLSRELLYDGEDYFWESSHKSVTDYEGYVRQVWATNDHAYSDKDQPLLVISENPPSYSKQSAIEVELFKLKSIEVISDPRAPAVVTAKVGAVATGGPQQHGLE